MLTRSVQTPLVRLPQENVVFPFNLIRIPPSNDVASAEQMVAKNRRLYERILNAGGCQYPVSALPMSKNDWTHHFGSKWSQLANAKVRYDPLNILAPGYNLF